MITCLVLTDRPISLTLPRFLAFANHVSQFDSVAQLHHERIRALSRIKTKYFFFHEHRNPLPTGLIAPTKGLVYGDYIVREGERTLRFQPPVWPVVTMPQDPIRTMRKAVCETRPAQLIAAQLPRGDYHTEYLLYYFLAKHVGHAHSTTLDFVWDKTPEGFYTKMDGALQNSVAWSQDPVNDTKIREALRPHTGV